MAYPRTKAVIAISLLTVMVGKSPEAHAQTKEALGANCAGLRVTLKSEIDRMQRLQESARKEQKAPPADLVSAWQRTFGAEGDGIPSLKELKKVRERADKLNGDLQASRCATIDIDQALQAPVQEAPRR
jgi:hypothetical protein